MTAISTIPFFPLAAVVFPGEVLALHIFEEQYKTMISVCLQREETKAFGVTFSEKKVSNIGCGVTIEEVVKEYDDGRYDISTLGRRRYRLKELILGEKFPMARVEFFDDRKVPLDSRLQEEAVTLHYKLIELVQGGTKRLDPFPMDQDVSFKLAHSAGLTLVQKQELLEIDTENQRLEYLKNYYKQTIPTILDDLERKELIRSNGHFKKLPSFKL